MLIVTPCRCPPTGRRRRSEPPRQSGRVVVLYKNNPSNDPWQPTPDYLYRERQYKEITHGANDKNRARTPAMHPSQDTSQLLYEPGLENRLGVCTLNLNHPGAEPLTSI